MGVCFSCVLPASESTLQEPGLGYHSDQDELLIRRLPGKKGNLLLHVAWGLLFMLSPLKSIIRENILILERFCTDNNTPVSTHSGLLCHNP